MNHTRKAILFALAAWFTTPTANAQLTAATPNIGVAPQPSSSDTLKTELLSRVEALSKIASDVGFKAKSLSQELASAPLNQSGSMLQRASSSNHVLGVLADPGLRSAPEIRTTQEQQNAARTLAANSETLSAYSTYLANLHGSIAAATPADALNMLRGAFVPQQVQMVVDPLPNVRNLSNVRNRNSASSSTQSEAFPIPAPHVSSGDGLIPFIIGGATSVDYPSVGALLAHDPANGLSTICTATLISSNAILTAAHCADQAPQEVFFQHAGTYALGAPIKNPKYSFPLGDLAIIPLKGSVQGIVPAEVNSSGNVPAGSGIYGVGFGEYSLHTVQLASTAPDQLVLKTGIKVHAAIVTGKCPPNLLNRGFICWTYVQGAASRLLGSTCEGDSGGPLFRHTASGWVLVGVASGGNNCSPGAEAFNTEVFTYLSWITITMSHIQNSNLPVLSSVSLQPVANMPPDTRFPLHVEFSYLGTDGTLSKEFEVPGGVSELRVSVNSVPTGSPLRLEVDPTGKPPTCGTTAPKDTSDTEQSCDYRAPQKGSWHVKVIGQSSQPVQLVATIFPNSH